MARSTVTAALLQEIIGDKFKRMHEIVVSFSPTGLEFSNKMKSDKNGSHIEAFIGKKDHLEWNNRNKVIEHLTGNFS